MEKVLKTSFLGSLSSGALGVLHSCTWCGEREHITYCHVVGKFLRPVTRKQQYYDFNLPQFHNSLISKRDDFISTPDLLTFCLFPHKILHKFCFRFVKWRLLVSREIENKVRDPLSSCTKVFRIYSWMSALGAFRDSKNNAVQNLCSCGKWARR